MTLLDASVRALNDSSNAPMPGAVQGPPVGLGERFRVNVYLRRREDLPSPAELGALPPRKRKYLSHDEFESKYGAEESRIRKVVKFAAANGLDVIATSAAKRTVTLGGTAASFASAFNTLFHHYVYPGGSYRAHTGTLHVPSDLANTVTAVVGFDERPMARPQVAFHNGLWDPRQVARAQWSGAAAGQQRAYLGLAALQGRLAARNASKGPISFAQAVEIQNDFVTQLVDVITDAQRAALLAALDELDIKTPPRAAQLYNFPGGTDGSGECIGLIELGGGWNTADVQIYFSFLGLPVPSITNVGVAGGENLPNVNETCDSEVALDIQVSGGAAPGAKIACYFAPLTTLGFVDAVQTAIHDQENRPSVISASWDLSEAYWLQAPSAITVFEDVLVEAALLGITLCFSAGDYGAASEFHDGSAWVDYPASSPHVLGVGGTTLVSRGTTILDEVTWNSLSTIGQATGGGVSQVFPLPDWQLSANVPVSVNPGVGRNRGVPDIAANADPSTGYLVQVDGRTTVIGGTSSAAPLWAALIARINQSLGKRAGYFNPLLYSDGGSVLRDIVIGNNGAYSAGPGWDACTGYGSPDGTRLRDLLGT